MNNKSKLRQEYEAVFGVVGGRFSLYGVVGGRFSLYDARGNMIYYELSDVEWFKYQYDAEGNENYIEQSIYGVLLDNRPCSDKVFIDEKTGKKFKMTEIK